MVFDGIFSNFVFIYDAGQENNNIIEFAPCLIINGTAWILNKVKSTQKPYKNWK